MCGNQQKCFEQIGIQIEWKGNGFDEIGIDKKSGNILIRIGSQYFRPTEVDSLCGDCTRTKQYLNWKMETSFVQLVKEMMDFGLSLSINDPN